MQPLDTTIANSIGEEALSQMVSVFPNPASDKIQISSSVSFSRIIVWDQLGQTIELKKNNGKEGQIQLTDMAPGIYYLSLYNEDGSLFKTIKFVKLND